jgi:acyl dehydratase
MPLDQRFVGRTYGPSPAYEVGREKIAEFADAIGDDALAYRDPAVAQKLGHLDVIAPPTFPILISMRASHELVVDPELGLDYSKVVHGEQRFVHHRPVRAGDRLTSTLTVDAIKSLGGNDILSTRTEIATEAGEPVCTTFSTLVARGTAAEVVA